MKRLLGALFVTLIALFLSAYPTMAASSISVTVQKSAGTGDNTVAAIMSSLKDIKHWQNSNYYTKTIKGGHTVFNFSDYTNVGSATAAINMDLNAIIKVLSSLQGKTISAASYKELQTLPGTVTAMTETYKSDVLHLNDEGALAHLSTSSQSGAYKQIVQGYNKVLAGNNQGVKKTGALLGQVDGISMAFSGDVPGGHQTIRIGPTKSSVSSNPGASGFLSRFLHNLRSYPWGVGLVGSFIGVGLGGASRRRKRQNGRGKMFRDFYDRTTDNSWDKAREYAQSQFEQAATNAEGDSILAWYGDQYDEAKGMGTIAKIAKFGVKEAKYLKYVGDGLGVAVAAVPVVFDVYHGLTASTPAARKKAWVRAASDVVTTGIAWTVSALVMAGATALAPATGGVSEIAGIPAAAAAGAAAAHWVGPFVTHVISHLF